MGKIALLFICSENTLFLINNTPSYSALVSFIPVLYHTSREEGRGRGEEGEGWRGEGEAGGLGMCSVVIPFPKSQPLGEHNQLLLVWLISSFPHTKREKP